MDATSIAVELYREVPAKFTVARNARAEDAASHGDKALANEIRQWPKASASAWAIDQLGEVAAIDAFSALGSQLRDAQKAADRHRLDALLKQRKDLLATTTTSLRALAQEHGVHLSASALSEIEQSLQAALADEDAHTAVFSGRLVKPIHSDGLEPVDLSDVVAGPALRLHAQRPTARARAASSKQRESKASAERLARARKAAAAADARVQQLERERADLAIDQDALEKDARSLQAQFDQLAQRREQLDARSTQLERDRRRAQGESRAAHTAADRANHVGLHPTSG